MAIEISKRRNNRLHEYCSPKIQLIFGPLRLGSEFRRCCCMVFSHDDCPSCRRSAIRIDQETNAFGFSSIGLRDPVTECTRAGWSRFRPQHRTKGIVRTLLYGTITMWMGCLLQSRRCAPGSPPQCQNSAVSCVWECRRHCRRHGPPDKAIARLLHSVGEWLKVGDLYQPIIASKP